MKKTLALLLSLSLMLTLAACGGGPGNDGQTTAPVPGVTLSPDDEKTAARQLPDPAANINPSAVFEGQFLDERGSPKSDYWYAVPANEDIPEYFYLMPVTNIYWAPDPHDTSLTNLLETSYGFVTDDNNHCVPEETDDDGSEPAFDIVFIDPFTAYDYVRESYYIRGDLSYEEATEQLNDTEYVLNIEEYDEFYADEPGDCYGVSLNSDGTAVSWENSYEAEGEWELVGVDYLRLYFDYESEDYYIFRDDNGNIEYITSTFDTDRLYLPQ